MKEYVVWEEVFNNGIDIAEKTVVEVWLPYNPKRQNAYYSYDRTRSWVKVDGLRGFKVTFRMDERST